jgi:hypothetical protein
MVCVHTKILMSSPVVHWLLTQHQKVVFTQTPFCWVTAYEILTFRKTVYVVRLSCHTLFLDSRSSGVSASFSHRCLYLSCCY